MVAKSRDFFEKLEVNLPVHKLFPVLFDPLVLASFATPVSSELDSRVGFGEFSQFCNKIHSPAALDDAKSTESISFSIKDITSSIIAAYKL